MKFLKLVHPLVGLVWLQIIHAYTPPFTRIVPCSRTLQAATSLLSTTKQPSTHEKDNNQDSKQSALSNLYSVSTADGAGANHDASAASASSATATAETSMTMTNTSPKHGILLVYGPDQKGIVAAFSQLLYGHGCGITSSEQSTDTSTNLFFQRICFDYSTMHTDRISLETGIREVCQRFRMQNRVDWCQRKKRVAIMVSKYDHCLWEILLRHQARELDCDISVIISNHPDLQHVADTFAIPFQVIPITKENKKEQEENELNILKNTYNVDLVILARYMQIISDTFCSTFPFQVINIHHSFLPAFVGGKPYHRAHARGVKVIGATAHYATAELDEGPIIEQDVVRISHRDGVEDLIRKGRTLEKTTLVAAVKAHLEDRIIVYNNKCVVLGD